jgi:hypothetical protein
MNVRYCWPFNHCRRKCYQNRIIDHLPMKIELVLFCSTLKEHYEKLEWHEWMSHNKSNFETNISCTIRLHSTNENHLLNKSIISQCNIVKTCSFSPYCRHPIIGYISVISWFMHLTIDEYTMLTRNKSSLWSNRLEKKIRKYIQDNIL